MNRLMEMYATAIKEREKLDQLEKLVSPLPDWFLVVQNYLNEQKKQQELIDLVSPKLPEWYIAQQKVIDEVTQILERPQKIQDSLIVLANNGWYSDFDLFESDLFEIAEAFAENDCESVEIALADYFHSHRTKIRDFLNEHFPHRRHIFEAAFEAHEKEKYVLSIPVLMTQIDGMCKEKTGASFFIGGDQNELSQSLANLVSESYLGLFIAPFEEKTSVRMSSKERLKFLEKKSQEEFKEVNRHLVLHGESIDYGTYLNSLKMISLAYYLARILTCIPS